MAQIITLDENTINKIAAGEVIERPASIVKELVENSIDAGATRITVEVKNGGITYIRVTDDGRGISDEDVPLAFESHSTSKIRHADDLFCVKSLGFRGEALASIAAVSKVRMVTRTKENDHGISALVHGGKIMEISKTGAPQGTSIIVESLFYNTPARYKFLKKDTTESSFISEIITRLALGNPAIAFTSINNDRVVLKTPGNGDLLSAMVSVYGMGLKKELLGISYRTDGIQLSGYCSNHFVSRSNRNYQTIYINGRYVKNRTINLAIDDAYKTLMMKNSYPTVLINLDISQDLVDVNVHPAKLEVRFSKEREIYAAVYDALTSALNAGLDVKEYAPVEKPEKEVIYEQPSMDTIKDFIPPQVQREQKKAKRHEYLENTRYMAQFFQTYIALQGENEIIFIDQHAAHERIMYEELKKRSGEGESFSQQMLEPVVLELSHQEFLKVGEHRDLFSQVGFVIEEFGSNSVIIRALPYNESSSGIRDLFFRLLESLDSQDLKNKDFSLLKDEFIYQIACKAAIKAKKSLTFEEVDQLMEDLATIDNPFTCPHGRPTAIKITKPEIEKMFKRRL